MAEEDVPYKVSFPAWDEETSLDTYREVLKARAESVDGETLMEDTILLAKAFIQENFCGPPTDPESTVAMVTPVGCALSKLAHRKCVDNLMIDGEVLPVTVKRPLILLVALVCADVLPNTLEAHIWKLRINFIYQRVLSRRSFTLRRKLQESMQVLLGCKAWPVMDPCHAQIHLECGHVYDYFREIESAEMVFLKAKELTGLETEITGVLGVRTQYQEFKLAQLTVVTRPKLTPEPYQEPHPGARMRIIQNDDCYVLQRPSHRNLIFKEVDESEEAAERNLAIIDQAVLISLCLNVKNQNPDSGLTQREMLSYVERVMECSNQPYPLLAMTLHLKARLEWERTKVQERALLQLQEMVDNYLAEDGDSAARFPYLFMTPFPSYVKLLKDMGRRYLSLGMNKTAENIGEQLQDMEFVVHCCMKQGNVKRAEKLARDQLEEDPDNALHWCALAEATESKEHFLTAWEKSGKKLARAMRGLARRCVDLLEWEESIQYFDAALALNPLYGGNWFTLGSACMRTSKWERAVQCFTRVVQLDFDDAMGWNNLGACLIHLDRKKEAMGAMANAMKLSEWSWRTKENYVRIALECGECQLALYNLMQILEMRGHEYKMDIDVLKIMFEQLVESMKEMEARAKEEQATKKAEEDEADQNEEDQTETVAIPKAPAMTDVPTIPKMRKGTVPNKLPADRLRDRINEFAQKLVGTYTDVEGIYGAVADYYGVTGDYKRQHELTLKQERAVKKKDWNQDLAVFEAIVKVSLKHTKIAIEQRDVILVSQSSRMIKNTIKGAQENFKENPLVQDLKDQLKALDDAQGGVFNI